MLIFVMSPITYNVDFYAFLYFFGFYAFFLLGWLFFTLTLSKGAFLNKEGFSIKNSKLSFLLKSTFILLICSLIINVYDFFIVGDVLNKGIVALREERTVQGARGSIVGVLIVLLSAFPVILLVLAKVAGERQLISTFKQRWYLYFSVLGIIFYFLSGGRNNFAIALVFYFIFISFFNFKYRKANKINIKKISVLGLFTLLILFIFLYIFIERVELIGISMKSYTETLEQNFSVTFYKPNFDSIFFENFYYAFLTLLFYINHSLMEFSKYFINDWSSYTSGVMLLPQVFMLIDVVFSTSFFLDAIHNMILHGVYLSAPGFLYLDFSLFGLVFPFFAGLLLPYAYRNAASDSKNDLFWFFIYASLTVFMIFSPVYNVFSMLMFPLVIAVFFIFILAIIRVFLKNLNGYL